MSAMISQPAVEHADDDQRPGIVAETGEEVADLEAALVGEPPHSMQHAGGEHRHHQVGGQRADQRHDLQAEEDDQQQDRHGQPQSRIGDEASPSPGAAS